MAELHVQKIFWTLRKSIWKNFCFHSRKATGQGETAACPAKDCEEGANQERAAYGALSRKDQPV